MMMMMMMNKRPSTSFNDTAAAAVDDDDDDDDVNHDCAVSGPNSSVLHLAFSHSSFRLPKVFLFVPFCGEYRFS